MLQNAYFLAKIGADTAENEQHFAEILPKTGNYPTGPVPRVLGGHWGKASGPAERGPRRGAPAAAARPPAPPELPHRCVGALPP